MKKQKTECGGEINCGSRVSCNGSCLGVSEGV
jgi:hypothetical protein